MSNSEIRRFMSTGDSYCDPAAIPLDGHLIEVSGQLGLDEDGSIPDRFEREAWLCFEHLERSLERAGAGFGDVLRIRAYITDLDLYGTYAEQRAKAFGDEPPASTAVGVSALLLGASLEIEATAFLPAS